MQKVIATVSLGAVLTISCGATVPKSSDIPVKEPLAFVNAQKANETITRKEIPIEEVYTKSTFYESLNTALQSGDEGVILEMFASLPPDLAGDVDINCVHASLLLSSGNAKDAKVIAARLLQENPKDADVLLLNMQVAKALNDTSTKSKMIKQLIAINPNDPYANTELGDEQSLKRNYKVANTYYCKAVLGDSSNTEALFGVGKTSYFLGNNAAGRSALNRILSLEPQNASAYSYLAKIAAEESNFLQAINYIKQAIAIDSSVVDYHLDYGTYLRSKGDFAGAEAEWTNAINLEPDYFLGYAYRGGLYDEQDKFELALKDYKSLTLTNPKYYFAYEAMGCLYWHEGKWEQARQAFAKARIINDDNISYPLMIAACYYKEGKKQEAKKFLEPVLKSLKNKGTLSKSIADKDRYAIEYDVARLYYDFTGEATIAQKVKKLQNSNRRGKLLYYMGLFCEINGGDTGAQSYYSDVLNLNSPMFFEYRLAMWSSAK